MKKIAVLLTMCCMALTACADQSTELGGDSSSTIQTTVYGLQSSQVIHLNVSYYSLSDNRLGSSQDIALASPGFPAAGPGSDKKSINPVAGYYFRVNSARVERRNYERQYTMTFLNEDCSNKKAIRDNVEKVAIRFAGGISGPTNAPSFDLTCTTQVLD